MRIVSGGRSIMECPPEIQARLTRAGGRNIFGGPNYRIVWCWSRLVWMNGRRREFDEDGNFIRETGPIVERVPLLRHSCAPACEGQPEGHQYERWQIEVWKPAEFYGSPEEWYRATGEFDGWRNVAQLGPYPSRGYYEAMDGGLLETRDHQFAPLSARVADAMMNMILMTKARTMQQIRDQNRRIVEDREKRLRAETREIVDYYGDFNPNPFVGYRGSPKERSATCATA